MILALGWKEYREQRTVWVVMAALGAVLVYGLAALLAPHGADAATGSGLMAIVLPALAMAGTYGLVCGAITLANERETGTLPFLDVLTGRRTRVWWAKLLAGALLTLTQSFVLIGVIVALDFHKIEGLHSGWYWGLPLAGLEAFAWGMCTSALCRNVLPAAAVATLPLGMSWVVGGDVTWTPHVFTIVIRVALVLVALGISGLVFCRDDWGRLSTKVWARPSAAGIGPSGWQALLWLTARQARGATVALSVLGILIGLLLPFAWPLLWPVATLLLGVLCGTGAFGGEQSSGAARFLGDQRLPLGRVWGMKIACWLSLAVLVSLLILVTAFLHVLVRVVGRDSNQSLQQLLGVPSYLLHDGHWDLPAFFIFLTLWLVYGYSIGQLFSMIIRKSAVAVVIALMASATVVAFWIPALVSGGLHLWQVFFVPAVLLAATRLVIWAWASNRLYTLRPGLVLIGCGFLSAAWTAGNLGYRAVEIPDTGEPFDMSAYLASLPKPEQNQAGDLIRKALRGLQERDTQVREALNPQPHPQGGGMMGGMGMPPMIPAAGAGPMDPGAAALPDPPAEQENHDEYFTRIDKVRRQGWPAKDEKLGRWLDRMCKGEWLGQLREAAELPLGMLENPGNLTIFTRFSALGSIEKLGPLLSARALQLQAQGDDRAALDHLIVLLAVSRNLRNHAVSRTYLAGWKLEQHALQAIQQWLTRLGRKPELVRRALAALAQHEASLPPVTDVLKGDYIIMRNTLESLSSLPRYFYYDYGEGPMLAQGVGELLVLAAEMPWEKTRRTRILDAAYAGAFRFAEADYAVVAAQTLAEEEARTGGKPDQHAPHLRYLWGWLPAVTGPGASLSRERLAHFIERSWLGRVWQWPAFVSLYDRASLCRVRGRRLVLALALYQMDKGKPVGSLEELAPNYLPAPLPVDPYSGKPFQYRVSQGEQVRIMNALEDEPPERTVPAGQGMVWSVGPDTVDQGGTKQGENRGYADVLGWQSDGLDWLFFVPEVTRK